MKDHNNIKLCDLNDCTGCMACVASCGQNAISIETDCEGFKYPYIDPIKCIGCHKCEKSCQVIYGISKNERGKIYAAWSLNNQIRNNSSSGGVFSELALGIINSGGVVVGASLDNETGYVSHIIVDNDKDLSKLRGSKYVQSFISSEVYKQIRNLLKQNVPVLFSGCPCQIAGLKLFLKHDYLNLYTLDLVCHGVPSPKYFVEVFKSIKLKYKNLIYYNFRDYEKWIACVNSNVYVMKNNNLLKIPVQGKITHYQDAFLKGYLSRNCCYKCNFSSIERVGDITLADFWGIGKYKPIRDDYRSGCSMVSINSKKGEYLFDIIKEHLFYEERNIQETIDGGNEQLIKPSFKPNERETYYKDFFMKGTSYVIKKYKLKLYRESILHKLKVLLWKLRKK